jgi:amino acid transporter
VLAAAVSNIALFEAELSGDSYQLMGMADRGLIPKLFTKRSRFGTPKNGIIVGTVIIIVLCVADFDQLVEMLNFAYSMAFLMEFSAFVKLRITHADVERPYRVPVNTFGCILLVTPPSLFLLYLMAIASTMTYVYFAVLCVFGFGFHSLQKVLKHYHLAEYVEAPKRPKRTASGSALSSVA